MRKFTHEELLIDNTAFGLLRRPEETTINCVSDAQNFFANRSQGTTSAESELVEMNPFTPLPYVEGD